MKVTGWVLLFLFVPVAQVCGAKLATDNFADGYYLEVDGKGAIYTVELPQTVYSTVTRKDLGDVRVFNGAGEVVPHTIRMVRDKDDAGEAWQPVPMFPLYLEAEDQLGDLSMKVRRSSDGSILEVRSKGGEGQVKKQLEGYLLDVSRFRKPLTELLCAWGVRDEGAMVTVSVDSSDNLVHWRNRLGSGTLAEMSFNGDVIRQNKISLPSGIADKYLRLRWLDIGKGLTLTGVRGRVADRDPVRNLKWLAARSSVSIGEDDHPELSFALEHLLPFSGLKVWLPDNNSVAAMTLYSRRDEQQPWQKRCAKNFYQLRVDDVELVDNICSFPPVDHAYWKLVVTNDGAGIGEGDRSVNVQFGYRPHELAFVARGNPPYLLAYGSGMLKDALVQPVPDIISAAEKDDSGTGLIKRARLGKKIELGGVDALAVPEPPVPWKTWLLWSILVAGVMMLVFMARSLLRDMGERKNNAP